MTAHSPLKPTFASKISSSDRALIGIWACAANSVVTEICAGSGIDWLLIDVEHSPNTLDSVLSQLQAVEAYPAIPLVRLPSSDQILIKQFLDLGAQNILIPMVETAEQAETIIRSHHYPPRGNRGIGAALARSARWNRVEDYLENAQSYTSLFIQIESARGVENVDEILALDGIDGVFIGPADLAASVGLIGQSESEEVRAIVRAIITKVKAAGMLVGVNAFTPSIAQEYLECGVDFVAVTSDVSMLARGSEAIVEGYIPSKGGQRSSY